MDLPTLGVFLLIVAFAALTQTITGFAMGLIIVAATAALDLFSILEVTAIISIISMTNTWLVLRQSRRGINMMFKPAQWPSASSNPAAICVGFLGGFFGGLYSAAGAPIAYFLYRQPETVATIRLTLLAVFFLSTFSRAMMGAVYGHFTEAVLLKTALALPLVILITMGLQRKLAQIPDQWVRRLVFIILQGVGAWLVIQPLFFA